MEIVHELMDPFPHLIVENMYNEEELKLIWEELEFLNKPSKLKEPEEYKAAPDSNGGYKTKSKALILDDVYFDRSISNILTVNRKLFNYCEVYSNLSPYHSRFRVSNYDNTKIRYYSDGEYYDPHMDIKFDTIACTYFYKEPKKFVGGDLFFPQFNYTVECKNNLCIIFPAYFIHEVKQLQMPNEDYNLRFGRYCMTQFTDVIPEND